MAYSPSGQGIETSPLVVQDRNDSVGMNPVVASQELLMAGALSASNPVAVRPNRLPGEADYRCAPVVCPRNFDFRNLPGRVTTPKVT